MEIIYTAVTCNMAGCSTTNCTGLVKSVVFHYLNRGSQVFGCFLDAFDLVDHQILFQIVVFPFLFFGS